MEPQRIDRLSTWLVRSDSRRSAFQALAAAFLATGLSTVGRGDGLARNKRRRTNCKKLCPECQKLKKKKCQCKPKPDGTSCFTGTCADGVCLPPEVDL
jgi:hypothetical protein